MFENLQELKFRIRKFAKRNAQTISRFLMGINASIVALLVVMPLGLYQPSHYETEIKLAENSNGPLLLDDNSIQVVAIPSRDEIKDATWNLDTEAIKILVQEIAKEYDVDWRLVYAIGAYESGNYSSHLAQTQFNFFGRKASSTRWASWDDPEEAIRNQFDYLQSRYFNRGLNTPAKIGPVYCEGNTWAGKITSIMNTL